MDRVPRITHATASANILAACEAGAIVQNQWHGRDSEGREIACLLGAIHPKVRRSADCNGDLMPMWLAEMTPTLFDGLAPEQALPMARRYGDLVGRWHALSAAQWGAILSRVLIYCIDSAVAAARPVSEGTGYWPEIDAACAQCRAAIESGDKAAARDAGAAAAAAAAAVAYHSLFTFVLDQIEAELPEAA